MVQVTKTITKKKPLTFGEFIAAVHETWGNRQAKGLVRLAVNAHLIKCLGRKHFLIS